MSVDTACSASLVATALARQTLVAAAGSSTSTAAAGNHGVLSSESSSLSSALTGGVNMLLLPATTAMFSKAGMLSADGRCKTLDAAADGYVRSEAAGMMMLGVRETAHGALALTAGGGVRDSFVIHPLLSADDSLPPQRLSM